MAQIYEIDLNEKWNMGKYTSTSLMKITKNKNSCTKILSRKRSPISLLKQANKFDNERNKILQYRSTVTISLGKNYALLPFTDFYVILPRVESCQKAVFCFFPSLVVFKFETIRYISKR